MKQNFIPGISDCSAPFLDGFDRVYPERPGATFDAGLFKSGNGKDEFHIMGQSYATFPNSRKESQLLDKNDIKRLRKQGRILCHVIVKQAYTSNAYKPYMHALQIGDIILVTEKDLSGLWMGILNGKTGCFKMSSVDIVDEKISDSESEEDPNEDRRLTSQSLNESGGYENIQSEMEQEHEQHHDTETVDSIYGNSADSIDN